MKTIRTSWLALAAGATAEAALCGLVAMFGRFGPCGPGNAIAGITFLTHLPGFLVAESVLPQASWLQLPVTVVVTAALFSVTAFVVISAVRRFNA